MEVCGSQPRAGSGRRGKAQPQVWLCRGSGVLTEPASSSQVIESRTLALARSLSRQLQTSCLVLVSSLPGLPTHIQQEALLLSHAASQGYHRGATRLGASRVRLERIRESLDDIMDYMVNNTPLNWLVGPFYPRMVAVETPTAGPPHSGSSLPYSEVEMEPLHPQGET